MSVTGKYLFINSAKFWGGGEQWFLQCARELAQRGHDVIVAGRKGGVFLRRIAEARLDILPLSLASDLALGDVWCMRQWLRIRRPQAILCNFTRDVRVVGRARRLCRRTETRIFWITGSILLKNTRRHRRLVQKYVDRFVVPSKALKREMLAFGYVDPGKIDVLPIGLDLNLWPAPTTEEIAAARAQAGISDNRLVVGVFARLEPRKGQQLLIEVWDRVRANFPTAELWLVGTGSAEDEWRHKVRECNIQGIKFVGFAENVRELMLACEVIAQPSLYEPFGITLLEAMACAKPVLCTSAGGMPEVVEKDRTALVVTPGVPEELSDALCLLLSDEIRRDSLGTAGRRRVEEFFRLEKMIDRLEKWLLRDAK